MNGRARCTFLKLGTNFLGTKIPETQRPAELLQASAACWRCWCHMNAKGNHVRKMGPARHLEQNYYKVVATPTVGRLTRLFVTHGGSRVLTALVPGDKGQTGRAAGYVAGSVAAPKAKLDASVCTGNGFVKSGNDNDGVTHSALSQYGHMLSLFNFPIKRNTLMCQLCESLADF